MQRPVCEEGRRGLNRWVMVNPQNKNLSRIQIILHERGRGKEIGKEGEREVGTGISELQFRIRVHCSNPDPDRI